MSPRAILSVHDKTGLVEFGAGLVNLGWELFSTGGSLRSLEQGGVAVRPVSELTGFPELMDGRVKTLHPAVHGGILARRDLDQHLAQAAEHRIGLIDLVAVNLYPFEATVASGANPAEIVEQIDIGGPAMVRSAAKNHASVTVVVNPARYSSVLEELVQSGGTSLATRVALAGEAFAHTAAYDGSIAAWFGRDAQDFPDQLSLAGRKREDLRYGENPHQRAAFYQADPSASGIAGAAQLQGKELSYNNIVDAAAAWELASEFEGPAVAIIKHTNPCGTALGETLRAAWDRAFACDTISAFGGVVACNREVDAEAAQAMAEIFLEVIVAPGYSGPALEILGAKKNLRLLEVRRPQGMFRDLVIKAVPGGFLAQTPDREDYSPGDLTIPTRVQPTEEQMLQLAFAWKVCKHVKSNAIVFASDYQAFGIGAGQMNRVGSVRLAAAQAGARARGAVMASDAFFPFPDGIEEGGRAGIVAVIQPGGGSRVAEIIEAADRCGMAMVFTGTRHFRH